MSNRIKQQTTLNKSVYLLDSDAFYKVIEVDENQHPVKIMSRNGIVAEVKNRKWILGHSRSKIIKALVKAIIY